MQHTCTLNLSASTPNLLCACLQACENVGLDQDQLIVTGKGGDLVYGSAEAVESGEWWPPCWASRATAVRPVWSSSILLHKQRQRPAAELLGYVCFNGSLKSLPSQTFVHTERWCQIVSCKSYLCVARQLLASMAEQRLLLQPCSDLPAALQVMLRCSVYSK